MTVVPWGDGRDVRTNVDARLSGRLVPEYSGTPREQSREGLGRCFMR